MDTRNKAILIILLVIVVMASVFVGIVIYQYKANYNKMITHHETNLSYLVDSEFVNLARIYSARLKGFIRSNKSVVKAFADRDKPHSSNSSCLVSRLSKRKIPIFMT